eukprot:806262_1
MPSRSLAEIIHMHNNTHTWYYYYYYILRSCYFMMHNVYELCQTNWVLPPEYIVILLWIMLKYLLGTSPTDIAKYILGISRTNIDDYFIIYLHEILMVIVWCICIDCAKYLLEYFTLRYWWLLYGIFE